MKLDDSWLARAIKCKYNGEELVHSKAEAVAVIKEAPVVIGYIDEKYFSKEMILAYINANDKYEEKYYDMLNSKDQLVISPVARSENRDFLIDGVHPKYERKRIDLTPYYDEDVLKALSSSYIGIQFTSESYDEHIVIKLINEGYHLVVPAYDYWVSELANNKKMDAHIRTKYELNVDDTYTTVALYKCVELIESKAKPNNQAYIDLILKYASEFSVNDEYESNVVAKFMKRLDVDLQNDLAREYCLLARYIDADNLAEDLVDFMAQYCKIAGNVLPDDIVLSNGLKVKDIDEKKVCNNCSKCRWAHARYI